MRWNLGQDSPAFSGPAHIGQLSGLCFACTPSTVSKAFAEVQCALDVSAMLLSLQAGGVYKRSGRLALRRCTATWDIPNHGLPVICRHLAPGMHAALLQGFTKACCAWTLHTHLCHAFLLHADVQLLMLIFQCMGEFGASWLHCHWLQSYRLTFRALA